MMGVYGYVSGDGKSIPLVRKCIKTVFQEIGPRPFLPWELFKRKISNIFKTSLIWHDGCLWVRFWGWEIDFRSQNIN